MVILESMFEGFAGGVHPPENKHTEKNAIEVMPSPKRVYIHFSQHTGKPARPLVEKDDVTWHTTGCKAEEMQSALW